MRNHYIVRYENTNRAGTRTLAIAMPVDSRTTADDAMRYITAACAKDCNARDADIRLYMVCLVHQVQ